MENTISDEESFHNSYHYFIEAVKILTESAEKQCELMGNYNVAWELKDDVSAGLYLLGNAASSLTEVQGLSIQQLIIELDNVPDSVLNVENTPESNLRAMKSPIWNPLRKQAARLLSTLMPATQNNEKYFN